MPIQIGTIEAIYRYPIKSMRGEPLDSVALGWHGLEGDRRLALRRLGERGSFPWLTASRLPALVLFTPRGTNDQGLPTHVSTPEGEELPVFGEALAAEVARRYGAPVEMMHLKYGIFDDAFLSVITSHTVGELCRIGEKPADARRFRPNLVVRSARAVPFEENDWIGGVLSFGDAAGAPAVAVTIPDFRCSMINVDPDRGDTAPLVLRAAAQANQTNAGIYATVTRVGRLSVGQSVWLEPAIEG
jgi:uncharacterized protein YcbX